MNNKFCINLNENRQIKVELYPDAAPLTVYNFKELVAKKFYDGLCFHRVISGFMIQGGGFALDGGELRQKECATIRGEFASNKVANDIKHTAGTLSMARAREKDSASSQFFICVADCEYLDGEYAAFGRVLDNKSLEVAIAISRQPTGRWMYLDDVPTSPVIIESIVEIE